MSKHPKNTMHVATKPKRGFLVFLGFGGVTRVERVLSSVKLLLAATTI